MVETEFNVEKLNERLALAKTQTEADEIGKLLLDAKIIEGLEELKKRPISM